MRFNPTRFSLLTFHEFLTGEVNMQRALQKMGRVGLLLGLIAMLPCAVALGAETDQGNSDSSSNQGDGSSQAIESRSDSAVSGEDTSWRLQSESEGSAPQWQQGGEAGTMAATDIPQGSVESTRVNVMRENYGLRLEPDTFRVRTLPSSRFSSHRGAGARIATFPQALAPDAPVGAYEVGPWQILTNLRLAGRYSDNFFLNEDEEKNDWTLIAQPTVGVDWNRADFGAGLRWQPSFYYPLEYDENERADHVVGFDANWEITKSVTAKFENVYGYRSVLSRTEDVDSNRFYDNETVVGLQYKPWQDWEMNLDYTRYEAWFRDPAEKTDDVTENGLELRAARRLCPAFWGLGRVSYTDVNNHNDVMVDTDNEHVMGALGVQFRPRYPLTGTLELGYSQRDYDASAIDDNSGPFVSAGLNYKLREWINFYMTASQTVAESSATGRNLNSGFSYDRTSVAVGSRWDIDEEWGIGNQVFYGQDDYDDSGAATTGGDRKDHLWGGNLSLYYSPWEWGQFVATYQYQINISHAPGEDFEENSVLLGLELSLSPGANVLGGI
mgnify:CR=1 FL=1